MADTLYPGGNPNFNEATGGSGDLGALLSSIFTGAIGAGQLFGGGSGSVTGSAAAGAAAANPFGGQFGSYQPQLQQAITGQTGQIGAVGSNISPIIQQLLGMGGNAAGTAMAGSPGSLTSQLNSLATNYMANPAIKAQYQLGLDTTTAGLAATGNLASGKQMVELEKYGQQFASNAYQQQFQDILAGNSQAFQQNATVQQLLAGALGTAGGLQNQASQIGISGQGNLIQQLLAASGATTGSPATAGGILSGQFDRSQQAQANLGSGLSGVLSRLLGGGGAGAGGGTGSPPGLSSLINSLLGGGGADAIIGSLGGAASFLGAGEAGGLLGVGGGLGSLGGIGDVSAGLGGILPGLDASGGIGSSLGLGDLGGIFSGFDSGAAGSAAAGGALGGGSAAEGAGVAAGVGSDIGAGAASLATPFAGAGLTLGIGFLGSALTGMTTPQQAATNLYNMGSSAFTPTGPVGINPLYGGFASIFGGVHDQGSANQAYQTLLQDEQNSNIMAQLFPNLPYSGEGGVNSPLIGAINSYAQQFVNTPSLWSTFSGVNPAAIYQQQNDALQMIGQSISGGGG